LTELNKFDNFKIVFYAVGGSDEGTKRVPRREEV